MKALNHRLSYFATLLLTLLLVTSCSDDKNNHSSTSERTFVMLAVNDMHANINQFPRFAFIVDSLRAIYPELFLVSAGDNQTGNPANDQFIPRGLPMIELMNELQFDLSAVGNHEFDTGQEGFALLTQKANFDFICSNIDVPAAYSFNVKPYKIIQTDDGLKIGIASLLQLGASGLPSCLPDYTTGFTFHNPFQTATTFKGMKDSCDAVVFVNHMGYKDDVKMAKEYPSGKLDVIVGGHSHTLLDQEEVYNDILVTQAGSKLKYASLITMLVKPNGMIESHMQSIPIDKTGKCNEKIQGIVDKYNNNPALHTPIAQLETPFTKKEQLGYLMCDAMRDATKVDIALVNGGGVRLSSWEMEKVTPYDVYMLDPFGNHIITINLSGKELYDFIHAGYKSSYHWIFTAGLHIDYQVKGEKLIDVKLSTPDGKTIDLNKKYSVAMNNYMISAMKFEHKDTPVNHYIPTAENLIAYLKKLKVVKSYQNEKRITVTNQETK